MVVAHCVIGSSSGIWVSCTLLVPLDHCTAHAARKRVSRVSTIVISDALEGWEFARSSWVSRRWFHLNVQHSTDWHQHSQTRVTGDLEVVRVQHSTDWHQHSRRWHLEVVRVVAPLSSAAWICGSRDVAATIVHQIARKHYPSDIGFNSTAPHGAARVILASQSVHISNSSSVFELVGYSSGQREVGVRRYKECHFFCH